MPGPDYAKMEEEVLARWESERVFEHTLTKPAPKGNFVFYEGPPTANGRPGIHHVEARAFKDIIPRFKTMQGYRVERKAGWDTHGLPVELEVEKKLGISGKPQIESLKSTVEESIAHFNALCKESVWTYVDEFRQLTRRMGYWLDLDRPYITYDPNYIESLWAITKMIWDRGLVTRDYKILPYCGRCGTALSSHEVAQGYKEVTDESVYVRFHLEDGRTILAWTTTPWTLPANVALAVGPDVPYVEVRVDTEVVIVAKARLTLFEGQTYEVLREFNGQELVGLQYTPLYTLATPDTEAYRIIAADFVSTEDGTGIVHIAPAFGEDDLRVGKENNLPVLMTVNSEARFAFPASTDPLGTQLHGMFVKDGDALIAEDLRNRGLLYRIESYVHEYPFCWRCSTPLIYYAKHSWFFAVTKVKEDLIRNAETISWTPDYIKEGRFGEWLKGIRDWAISRERYWGTPLPIWQCTACEERVCIGSFAELAERATPDTRPDPATLDPHRPFIDAVTLTCTCGSAMRRVSDVMDVWFDSGAMPFAQWHYPFENNQAIDSGTAFPAHYIAEAIDQTRGWFYTLLAVATLLGKPAPFTHVVCLGHILDAKGLKMSKSKGNVVDPFKMIDTYGADACRMYMYTVNQPGDPKRFDEADISLVVKQVLNLLLNVLVFWETYPAANTTAPATNTHVLDRWLLARTNDLVETVTADLSAYRITEAGRAIMSFVDDLSTWYVRRSRDRFKAGDVGASATLRQTLQIVSRLLAPFMPFFADVLYARTGGAESSVHLDTWPEKNTTHHNPELLEDMQYARRIVSFGLEARADTHFPIRQPLARATVSAKSVSTELVDLIRDELNVHEVHFVTPENGSITIELDTTLTPTLKAEGAVRELVRHIQNLRKTAGLTVHDTITLYIMGADDELLDAVMEAKTDIVRAVRATDVVREKTTVDTDTEVHLAGSAFWIGIRKQ